MDLSPLFSQEGQRCELVSRKLKWLQNTLVIIVLSKNVQQRYEKFEKVAEFISYL